MIEKRLIELLKKADDLYYNKGIPWLSDEDYDSMKDMAENLYPDSIYFNEVGSSVKKDKVKLPYILGSLEKVDSDNVEKWIEKGTNDILITEKLDGVSILVTYFGGDVVFASTRGNGEEGRDITEKARKFCKEIPIKEKVILRGECLLKPETDPRKLGYKTRRNMVAGILNRDDNKHADIIQPYFYELIESPSGDNAEYDKLSFVSIYLGLNTPRFFMKSNPSVKDLEDFFEYYKETCGENYDIDGLVLTRNDYIRENVKYPKNKVKFKIHAKPIPTTVKDIEWNTGRTGRIIPTIIINPVEIDGVKINRATGFNAEYIKENCITKGSEILILRSGDVIPYITEVTKGDKDGDIPGTCPKCGHEIEWKGVDIVCVNPGCSETSIKKTEFFLRTMGVENITRKTLEKIGVSSIIEAYEIDELEITSNVGIGLKKAEMIVNQIENTLKTTPERLLASFGIPNVGVELSKTICSEFDFDDLFEISEDKLTTIDGIGKVIAKKFVENIGKHKEIYEALKERGLRFKEVEKKSPVKGKTFTLTGSMPLKRDVIKRMIEENGGMVKNISKKVDYLVDANQDRETTKAKKAKQYGIPIISYEELMEMINE